MKVKTTLDLLVDAAQLQMVDPRPFDFSIRAKRIVQYLEHSGFMNKLNTHEREHLEMKVHSAIIGCVKEDRMEFHGIDNTTEDDA